MRGYCRSPFPLICFPCPSLVLLFDTLFLSLSLFSSTFITFGRISSISLLLSSLFLFNPFCFMYSITFCPNSFFSILAFFVWGEVIGSFVRPSVYHSLFNSLGMLRCFLLSHLTINEGQGGDQSDFFFQGSHYNRKVKQTERREMPAPP